MRSVSDKDVDGRGIGAPIAATGAPVVAGKDGEGEGEGEIGSTVWSLLLSPANSNAASTRAAVPAKKPKNAVISWHFVRDSVVHGDCNLANAGSLLAPVLWRILLSLPCMTLLR